ncbi:nitrate- and nitrite sensing domain-containing protein [Streptomyces sp. NPDC049954]|uniref:nitrate- and nitrite sensing domain-containing protein n=1 Tax=Streptomyces sp. NPDC049954 TaxID=3155779 RepID=UPI00344185A2
MQGRFKRDGSAAAEPEPRGGTDRGSSAQHTPQSGQAPADPGENRAPSTPDNAEQPKGKAKPKQSGPTGPGSRMALRNWRISTRLVSLLVLPVAAATTLGGLRISNSLDDIQQLDNMKLLTDMTKQATELAAALQDERDQSAGPLAHGVKATDYSVSSWRSKTDRSVKSFLENTNEISGNGSLNGVRSNLGAISTRLAQLKAVRRDAYADKASITQTVDAYSQLIDQLLSLSEEMAQATSNPEMVQRTRALAAFSSAKEYASVQRAVIAAALPPNKTEHGKLSETDRRYALNALSNETSELDQFREVYAVYGGNPEELLRPINSNQPTIESARSYANRALSRENGIKGTGKWSYKDWTDAASDEISQMKTIETTLLGQMEQKARELRQDAEREAILNGALIILVLGVSLVGAFVVSRSMIRSLRRLQDTATKVAQERLPELVQQLSESDPQDVDTSVESVGVHSRDEIGKVAAAFDDVHREAVRLAADQAMLRGNVNAMFTNLSRRSQGLIQRQLSLISELESREADPDQLSSLFKLDHLATRMRRNGENLLVLAGEEPGRRWTRPVPLVDVLRAAASEVEQYERIELSSVPSTDVAGRVVNDLVHLLAELLENATSFSSPQTKVKVTGHALPDGRVLVEIHDTGIGLSPEDLSAINERLAAPPTVDVSVSRRMGLFVVGRLSQRHGIRIQLRPSDSGGTTALVMLPVDVAQGGRKAPGGKPGGGGGPAAAQAAAGVAAARRGSPAPALGGAPGAGQGGPAGQLGAVPARGQVGPAGPRAALPGRDNTPQAGPGGRPAPQGQSPQGQAPQNRPPQNQSPQGQPPQSRRPQGGQGSREPFPQVGGAGLPQRGPGRGEAPQQDGNRVPGLFGDSRQDPPQGGVPARYGQDESQGLRPAQGPDAFGGRPGAPVPPPRRAPQGDAESRRPQLPPRGGPRAELPGGNPQPGAPRWGDQEGPAGSQAPLDAPRGHDEPQSGPATGAYPVARDDRGPGSTAQFPAITDDMPAPEGVGGSGYGGYDNRQDPSSTGQFPVPGAPSGTGGPEERQAHGQEGYGSASETGALPRQDAFEGRAPGQDAAQAPSAYPYEGYADGRQANGYPADRSGQYDTGAYATGQQGGQPTPQQNGGGQQGGYDAGRQDTGQFAAGGYETGQHDLGQYRDTQQGSGQGGYDTGAYSTGQFPAPAAYETGQSPQYDPSAHPGLNGTGRPGGQPGPGGARPGSLPRRGAPGESGLPSAGAGDGRTPLYDTLETNWFHGGTGTQQPPAQESRPAAEQPPAQPPAAAAPGEGRPANGTEGSGTWRASPNDELVRQAERVKQPSAGGITTSGLPRRVPRANLVPGTAQQQPQQHVGPQVSRAPDDVRGRLTNLRRGIQQGRYQAGNGVPPRQAGDGQSTGSHPRPSHQQER